MEDPVLDLEIDSDSEVWIRLFNSKYHCRRLRGRIIFVMDRFFYTIVGWYLIWKPHVQSSHFFKTIANPIEVFLQLLYNYSETL